MDEVDTEAIDRIGKRAQRLSLASTSATTGISTKGKGKETEIEWDEDIVFGRVEEKEREKGRMVLKEVDNQVRNRRKVLSSSSEDEQDDDYQVEVASEVEEVVEVKTARKSRISSMRGGSKENVKFDATISEAFVEKIVLSPKAPKRTVEAMETVGEETCKSYFLNGEIVFQGRRMTRDPYPCPRFATGVSRTGRK